MKKAILVALSALFMMAGCEGDKTDKAVEQTARPTVEQPAAKQVPVAQEKGRTAVKSIEWDKAFEMVANGALFVDVRNPPELNEGYAPEAVNIPLPELKRRAGELPKDRDLLVYCRSGRRSEAASRVLMAAGFDRVYNVAGGYLAYPRKQFTP